MKYSKKELVNIILNMKLKKILIFNNKVITFKSDLKVL